MTRRGRALIIVLHAKVVPHFVCQRVGRNAHFVVRLALHYARGVGVAVGRNKSLWRFTLWLIEHKNIRT